MNILFLKQKRRRKGGSGFTLIETLVAILILVMTMAALFTLAAGGFFSARYARNQIVGGNLLQESLETVRNSRDTAFLNGVSWSDWQAGYNVDASGSPQDLSSGTRGCFTQTGCSVDPYASPNAYACNGDCPAMTFYPGSGFYGYQRTYPSIVTAGAYATTYVRKIVFTPTSNPDQLIVTGTITWLNGNANASLSQSILITNWHS